jgi:hypothetical protein
VFEPVSPALLVKSTAAIPAEFVLADVAERRPAPSSANVTATPDTPLPQRSVTVAVIVVVPADTTDAGSALIVTLRWSSEPVVLIHLTGRADPVTPAAVAVITA